MKKAIWSIPAVFVVALVASIFRAKELAFGFDEVSGLPNGEAQATGILLVLAVIVAAVILVFTIKKVPEKKEFKNSIVYTVISLICCGAMLACAGYIAINNTEGETILYLYAGLCGANAISFALLGMKNLQANDHPIYSFFTFVQVLWSTLAVILVFRERVSEPIVEHFAFLLFAFLCVLIFTYAHTGYVFGKNRFAVAFIAGILGIYFITIELIAPFVATLYSPRYYSVIDFKIFIPLATYLVYMPTALFKIYRNENDVK